MTSFCEVRSTYVGGHAEHGNDAQKWCVVATADPELWLTAFEDIIDAEVYAHQVNDAAELWKERNP